MVLGSAAGAAGVAALGAGTYWAVRAISSADLMQAGPLGEQALGHPDAPVTIIEYASLTCPHCARFAHDVFPGLEQRYIRTVKVQFIFREFPFDPLGAGAFTLARCVDNARYFEAVKTLFQSQETWLVEEPVGPLRTVMQQFGLTEARFDACLADQRLLDGILWVRDRAANEFKVNATPTFFINKTKYVGGMSLDALEEIIRPLI